MWSRLALNTLAALLLAGCAAKRMTADNSGAVKVLNGAERSDVLAGIRQNQVYYHTFIGRTKANMSVNQEQYDATIHVRIIKDEAIWVSVTALLGMEVARMKITQDSMLLLNRLQRSYLQKPFSYLTGYMGENIRFGDLQDLFTGNMPARLLDRSSESVLMQKGEGYSLAVKDDRSETEAVVDKAFRTHRLFFNQNDDRHFHVGYTAYESFAGQRFPRDIDVTAKAGNLDMAVTMRYERIRYDESVEMPFSVPDSYLPME